MVRIRLVVLSAALSSAVHLAAECPKGNVNLDDPYYGNSKVWRLRWSPPAGTVAGTGYEILSSENRPSTKDYCTFVQGAGSDMHIVGSTKATSYDYTMPDNQVVQVAVQVAGCKDTLSIIWFADSFDPPQRPNVVRWSDTATNGQATFTFSEPDNHTYDVFLGRIDPAGETPDTPPVVVYPNTIYGSNAASGSTGYCPPGRAVTIADGNTPGTPDPLPPGTYMYHLVAFNFGLGRPTIAETLSDPLCVKVDCPACDCQSTLVAVDAGCESDSDIDCTRGIPSDLRKYFSSPQRHYVTADGAAEIVLFQAESTDGEITFSIMKDNKAVGSSAFGTLLPLGSGGGGTSIKVRPQLTIGKMRYAFVRYRAPADLPADPYFYVLATIPNRKEPQPGQWSYHPVSAVNLSLVPPPVVLVHGVWSGPGVWAAGLRDTIRKDGRAACDACLVDYSDAASATPNSAPSFDPASPDSSTVMNALDRAVDEARAIYRLSGFAVAQVDAIGHSMGGLVLRGRTVYPGRAYSRATNNFRGDFHKVITIGTPHAGSPLADWLVAHKCDRTPWGETIEKLMAGNERPLGPAIYEMQTGSAALRRLGTAAVPSAAIVGVAPAAITELEDMLDALPFATGNHTSVEGIMSAVGVHKHDVIVPAESQSGGLRLPTEVFGVVHARANAGTHDIPETESKDVWASVISALHASVSAPVFGSFGIPAESTTAPLEPVPCPVPTPPPPEPSPGTLSVVKGTVVHPGDALSVSFTPSSSSTGCFVTIGAETYVRDGACVVPWTVPAATAGRIDMTAQTFGPGAGARATSYVTVQPAVTPAALRITPASLTLRAKGEAASLTITATATNMTPIDVTSSSAGTTYAAQHGASVVAVSENGRVTALASGKDIITVSNHGVTTTMLVTVSIANRPPTLTLAKTRYILGTGGDTAIDLTASDPDGNAIAFSALALPPFATLTDRGNGTAVLRLRPQTADIGYHEIAVSARDNGAPALGAAATIDVTIEGGKRRAVKH